MFDVSVTTLLMRLAVGWAVLTVLSALLAVGARTRGRAVGPGGPSITGQACCAFQMTGWLRPAPAAPTDRAWLALLSVAGPLVVLVAISLGIDRLRPVAALHAPGTSAPVVLDAMRLAKETGVRVALLNAIPLPPLAAGALLGLAAPALHRRLLAWSPAIGLGLLAIFVALAAAQRDIFGGLA
ncbi:hypothetical protein [Salipiger sp. IMCC34102]|uniref:hypothetical protein n=1 Tax=Salipiger sp. IMCC34102 TaxID=2510647 RepID=UPI0013E9D6F7|nr:hypothetical protein [Salipiger sp. IMCC34102]